MTDIGTRVIALRNTDSAARIVYSYGAGVYVGDHPVANANLMFPNNPKIELDNGKVVYGYECWWGDADAVKARFDGWTFVDVDIDKDRDNDPPPKTDNATTIAQ